ncbi:MAG: NAD(+)/NADH kinase [Armatimonadota bacterium]|nr:NAD(+)/NADH kinase [Armatimonadota bacterium]MDR7396980.1 NAD(+)/NADH kinase [Armatimonadota bacterium]MDR7406708.1 NAD(+)/NADH kinase [Armatimonadota bacterium]MDR7409572.1 NAD(+)/NADH kinase [Armatimonadota bacterium]MDR7412088.1 NAD(+)/NADH kinase [Armatimonadota bacterium]
MRTVGVVVNPEKAVQDPQVTVRVREAVSILLRHGLVVRVNSDGARAVRLEELSASEQELAESSDALVVVGGDGTILRAARAGAVRGVPVLGVNVGGFGFLAEVGLQELPEALERLVAGRHAVEERMMLAAEVVRSGEVAERFLALNDMVVTKSGYARLMPLRVCVNGEHLATYLADGLILSTPTGSTAYNLSAGGPILSPGVRAMVITPICPHTLTARPVVVDADDVATVEVASGVEGVLLTVDGQVGCPLRGGDVVQVRRAEERARLVRLKTPSFYELLRRKFAWGER